MTTFQLFSFESTLQSIIIPYLQVFIEFCFTEGAFPKNCTIARIVPIFIKGERDKPTNYRPISILICFSKIFEGLLYKRINIFLNKHNVIVNSQDGFQDKVSTNYAFVDVITHYYDNINSNQYIGLVFLDLTKAFDSVNHDILLLKLDHYGIRGSTNQLIKSFLSRKQFVSIKGVKSKLLQNNYGVPQGSILGPLLVLFYINDMPHAVNCMPILFADDTCLIFTAPNLASLTAIMNKELQTLSIWFDSNKLTVNTSKSNFLIIPPKLNKPCPQTNVFLNNIFILQCINIKYLGLTIDMNLNFDFHISNVVYKISRTIGIISKIRHYLP